MIGISGTRIHFPRIFALAVLSALFMPGIPAALDWPAVPAIPTVGFGTPERGYLNAGIVLGGQPDRVHAAASGELLFVRGADGVRAGVPPVAGGLVAIAHSNGFVTVYTGMQPLVKTSIKSVDQGALIGIVSEQGVRDTWPPGFAIEDRTAGTWVNPLMLLPAVSTVIMPSLGAIAMVAEDGSRDRKPLDLPAGKNVVHAVSPGRYAVFARLLHPIRSGVPMVPYRIRMYANGIEQAVRVFDAAAASVDGLAFAGLPAPSGNGLDQQGRVLIGSAFLPQGVVKLKIVLEGIDGTARETTWRLEVR